MAATITLLLMVTTTTVAQRQQHPLSASIAIKDPPAVEKETQSEFSDDILKILDAMRARSSGGGSGATYMTDLSKWEECDKEFDIIKYMYERIVAEHQRLANIEVYLHLCNKICIGINVIITLFCLIMIAFKLCSAQRRKKKRSFSLRRQYQSPPSTKKSSTFTYFDHKDKDIYSTPRYHQHLLPPPAAAPAALHSDYL